MKTFVIRCLQKLSADECYPDLVQGQFKTVEIKSVNDITPFYHSISEILLKFNGDTDKFFTEFYNIVNKNDVCAVILGKQCNLLLGFELANHVVAHLTGGKFVDGTLQIEKTIFDGKQKEITDAISI